MESYTERERHEKLSLSERHRAPSLLHAPRGLVAAPLKSARGHSGNHLFPGECRARGIQEARLTNLRGKGGCLPMCLLRNTPPLEFLSVLL